MGLLAPRQVEAWRTGRIDFLEQAIQGNLKKISLSMATFRQWAHAKGLQPSETNYVRRTRSGKVDLRFSKSGDLAIEKSYRTHYVSPALSKRKQQQLQEKASRAAPPAVFQILRDSQCSECGAQRSTAGERRWSSASAGRAGATSGRASWLKELGWRKPSKNARPTPMSVQLRGHAEPSSAARRIANWLTG
jgi:hypothetical protein